MSRVALMALIGGLLLATALRRSDGTTAVPTDLFDWTEWSDWSDPPEPL